ncbi:MEMO1 family protein [Symbiodinium microadriaticum]|uniref:MEMO1 family protein n=1 Tax=Symbiodinium microadriaticum TaxID=2951 RepID=A0A1Q9CPR9_SYMMI|nr:MEMO1 family protein [Symbiodinium microadriaticum]
MGRYPVDERGHAREHSIENQLPFLQHLAPSVRIVPIGLSQLTLSEAEQLAKDIVAATQRENVLLIATTDYLHAGEGYYDQPPRGMHLHEFIRKRDAPLLASIEQCSTEELIRASGQTGMYHSAC